MTHGRLAPGRTIGILGGGQLGRMTALAAGALGYRCHIFTPEADSPASQVAAATTVADYEDERAIEAFAATVDVATFEFENVPVETVLAIERRVPVRPGPKALRVSQDRLVEKTFLRELGTLPAEFIAVDSPAALEAALAALGRPAVLKTARLGYDGKGQVMIDAATTVEDAWDRMGAPIGVLERFVDYACEISVVIARALDGSMRSYVPVENRHRNHILWETHAPARIAPALAAEAEALARRIAEALDIVGLLAVEMFVTRDGRVLVNEIAPRPHNSGHWTMDACVTSQFEQFVRAICGLPLGSPERHSDAVMTNLLGDEVDGWAEILEDPGAKLHLYGKGEARPGRKMGHVNRLLPRSA